MSYCQATFFKQSFLLHDSIMLFPPPPLNKSFFPLEVKPDFLHEKKKKWEAPEATLSSPPLDALPWLPVAHTRAHTHTHIYRLGSIFPLRSSQSLHGQGPLVFFLFGTRKRESFLTCGAVIPARTVKSSINNRTIPSRLWTRPEPGNVVSPKTHRCTDSDRIRTFARTAQWLGSSLQRKGITDFFLILFLPPLLSFFFKVELGTAFYSAQRNSTWVLLGTFYLFFRVSASSVTHPCGRWRGATVTL